MLSASRGMSRLVLEASGSCRRCSTYFFIRQITGGIRPPEVACRFRPNAEVTAADIQPAAFRAAAVNVFLFILQFHQQFVFFIRPDFAEWLFTNIAQRLVAPELVGINFAVPTYATNTQASAVAFIHLQ